MILLTHIIIAVSGLVAAGWTYLKPSTAMFRASIALTVLTFATGTYLVITGPAHLVSACESGLVYLAVVFAALIGARAKLRHLEP